MSLVEIIVYVGLLGVLAVMVSNSLIQIAGAYQRARGEREVLANARIALMTLAASAEAAQEIYAPTSKFNDDAGQISFVTAAGAMPGHETAYLDFWLDNGVIFSRSEGGATSAVTAASARIKKMRFERIVQGYRREAVKMTVQADSANARFPASVTLDATAALRGDY